MPRLSTASRHLFSSPRPPLEHVMACSGSWWQPLEILRPPRAHTRHLLALRLLPWMPKSWFTPKAPARHGSAETSTNSPWGVRTPVLKIPGAAEHARAPGGFVYRFRLWGGKLGNEALHLFPMNHGAAFVADLPMRALLLARPAPLQTGLAFHLPLTYTVKWYIQIPRPGAHPLTLTQAHGRHHGRGGHVQGLS